MVNCSGSFSPCCPFFEVVLAILDKMSVLSLWGPNTLLYYLALKLVGCSVSQGSLFTLSSVTLGV